MNRRFVLIISVTMFLIIGLIVQRNVKAEEVSGYKITTCESSPFGEVIQPENVVAKGVDIVKYCNLKEPALAFNKFMNKHNDYLNEIGFKYDDKSNLDIYDQYMEATGQNFEDADERQIEIMSFLDVYRTSKMNEIIDSLVSDINKEEQNLEQEQISFNKLYYLVPYDRNDELYSRMEKAINPQVKSKLNVAKASAFAKKYATHPESGNLQYPDCAQFVSQILRAGGIKNESGAIDHIIHQDWYSNLKCTNKKDCSKHHTGYATIYWINADGLKSYWKAHGRKITTYNKPSKASVVKNFREGDVILQDANGNGTINHTGYIAKRTTSDVTIAQHTDNYYKSIGKTNWLNYKKYSKMKISKLVMR